MIKKLLEILQYYALIPFVASIPGLVLNLGGLYNTNLFVVPLIAGVIYYLLRKKIDVELAAKTNGIVLLVLLVCFTGMMIIASGNIDGILMSNFSWLIIPFAPIMLLGILMGQYLQLYVTAFLTYLVSFVVTMMLGKVRIKRIGILVVIVIVCTIISSVLYVNRPSVKYGGHGFDYMHGFSSTDFSDYMVYSKNSKLVTLDEKADFIIEKEEDMPVLDGAEACYPLYASLAKAVYKDIDVIESKWLDETDNPYCNGKIVTFTNSVQGFDRLLWKEHFGNGIDMFFGARPSKDQLYEAESLGIELEITPIGKEAFVFFVEKHTPIDNLTSDQIKGIYHGDITNWSEVGGNDQEIMAFQRPKNSGSQTMMEYFMGDLSLKEPKTYEMVSAMEGVINRIAQYNSESGAMGYSFRYFIEELNQEKDVKILSVDGVYPSIENIENGSYPLVTDVCLITRKDDPNPNVRKMIDFVLSEQGQMIVNKTGYVGLNK